MDCTPLPIPPRCVTLGPLNDRIRNHYLHEKIQKGVGIDNQDTNLEPPLPSRAVVQSWSTITRCHCIRCTAITPLNSAALLRCFKLTEMTTSSLATPSFSPSACTSAAMARCSTASAAVRMCPILSQRSALPGRSLRLPLLSSASQP